MCSEILNNCTKCATIIVQALAHQKIKHEKTELRLGNNMDNSDLDQKPTQIDVSTVSEHGELKVKNDVGPACLDKAF